MARLLAMLCCVVVAHGATVTLVPNGDVSGVGNSVSTWCDQSAGTTNIYTTIDETIASANDADYVTTGANDPTGASYVFSMSDTPATAALITGINIRVRAKANGSKTTNLAVYYSTDGSDPSISLSSANLTTAFQTISYTPWWTFSLTKAQADALKVKVVGAVSGNGSGTRPQVSVVECIVTYIDSTTWNNGAGTGVWGTSGNWTNGLPDANHAAIFDATTTANCSVNVNAIAYGVDIRSGYTGGLGATISQQPACSMTIGANGWSQVAGTFTGAANGVSTEAITIGGNFSQTGGTFTATRATTSVKGAFSNNGGTFNHNNGLMRIAPSSSFTLLNQNGSATAQPFYDLTINDGSLLGYWRLDESASPSVDLSGNGNNATWQGSPTPSTTNLAPVACTDVRSMPLSSASSQYLSLATPANFATSYMTVAGWWYHSGAWGATGPMFNWQAISSTGYTLEDTASNGFICYIGLGGTSYNASISGLTAGKWYHVAGTYDGSAVRIYIDGVQKASTSISGVIQSLPSATASLGRTEYNLTSFLNSTIDDVRVYNRALSAGEIATLATGTGLTTATVTLGHALTVAHDLSVATGSIDVSTSGWSLTVGGSCRFNDGTLNARSGTITLNGATGGGIACDRNRFWNLTLGGAGTWTLEDMLRVDGTLALSNGALDVSASSYTVRAGAFNQTSGAGGFVPHSGKVVTDPTSSQTLSAVTTLNALRVEPRIDQGLIGYWKMDSLSGTTVRDYSGLGHTATINGSPRWSASAPTFPLFDDPGSFAFNGSTDYLSVPGMATSAITISAWINAAAIGPNNEDFVSKWGAGNQSAYNFQLGSDGRIHADISTTGADDTWVIANATISTGTWYHVAMTYDGTTITTYINGAFDASVAKSGPIYNSTAPVYIGRFDPAVAANRYFNGLLDDVRIYDRALSAAEIRNLANGRYATGAVTTSSPTESNLAAYWKFDDQAGTTATDSSGAGLSSTLTNSSMWTTSAASTTFSNAGGVACDGASTAVTLASSSNLNFAASTALTVCGWFKTTASYGPILSLRSSTTGADIDVCVGFNGDAASQSAGKLEGLLRDDPNSTTYDTVVGPTVNDGNWHHFAEQRTTAGALLLYCDGTYCGTQTNAMTGTITTDLRFIGVEQTWVNGAINVPYQRFAGSVDDVRVYKRLLSATEIANLANGLQVDGSQTGVTVSLGRALAATSFGVDSGVFDANGATNAVTNAFTLASGNGKYLASTANQSFAGGFTISGSTFVGSSGTLTITGDFSQAKTVDANGAAAQDGGSFTAPSSTMSVTGGFAHASGAAYAHDNGLVQLTGGSSGKSITSGGCSFYDLSITGTGGWTATDAMTIARNFTLGAGAFTAPSTTMSVAGNFTHSGGTFSDNGGTVSLNGANQTVTGSTTFTNFSATGTTARTITFAAGSTQTINGVMTLTGASGQLLSLVSSSPGSTWAVTPNGTWSCSFLGVTDSINTISTLILPTSSTDGGDTTNWFYPNGTWTGLGADNNWSTAGNWKNNVLPTTAMIARFTGDSSNKSCTIDASAFTRVKGVSISNGYSGTVTQGAGETVWCGSSGFSMTSASATWTCNDTLYTPSFSQTAGTFAGSGTLYLVGPIGGALTAVSALNNLEIEGLDTGLVAYWKLDEASGATAYDATWSGYDGTYTNVGGSGAPVTEATIKPTTIFADPASRAFTQANRHTISVADAAALRLGGAYTIAAWCRPNAPAQQQYLSSKISGNSGWIDHIGTDYNFYFNHGDGGATVQTPAVAVNTAGAWQHFAASWDGANVNAYKDGTFRGATADASGLGSETATLYLGSDGSINAIDGYFDDVRMYSRALSEAEVWNLQQGLGGDATQATAFTLGSNITVNGTLKLDCGTLALGANTLSAKGSCTLYGQVTGNATTGILALTGTGSGKTLRCGEARIPNLTVNSGDGTGVWTMQDRLAVAGTLTIAAGQLDVSASNYAIHCGTLNQTGAASTLVPRSGTIVVDSPTGGSIKASTTLNALRVESPGENGLVGYWKFDAAGGLTAYDVSGHGNTATLKGAAMRSATAPGTPLFDQAGSLTCDGVNDYADCGSDASLNLTGAVTVSCWVKLAAGGVDQKVFEREDNAAGGYKLTVFTTNVPEFEIRDSWNTPVGLRNVGGGTALATGTWYHVAGVYSQSGGYIACYVNGALDRWLNTSTVMAASSGPALIATEFGHAQLFFNGQIDDLRVYSRALSPAEIRNLANGRYANGATAGAYTLAANLSTATFGIDAGAFSANGFATTVTNLFALKDGQGSYAAGTATQTFNGGLTVSGSAFTGGSGTVAVNGDFTQAATSDANGALPQSGGTFTAPSGTMTVTGSFTHSGGTFAHNNGTVQLVGTAPGKSLTGTAAAGGGLFASFVPTSLRAINQDDWRATQPISGQRIDANVAQTSTAFGTAAQRGAYGIGGTDADWDGFSVQWDGWLTVLVDGTDLKTRSDDSSRVWIDFDGDGAVAGVAGETGEGWGSNNWGSSQPANTAVVAYHLPAGTYRIRVQYEEGNGGDEMSLLWTDSAHTDGAYSGDWIVPSSCLTPSANAPRSGLSFWNLTVAGSGGAWNAVDPLSVGGTLAISAGTLTQGTGATVTAGAWNQTGGAFTGSANGSIAENVTVAGAFSCTGGTCTSTASALNVSGDFTVGGTGTFTHNSGTVEMRPTGARTFTCSQTLNRFRVNDGLLAYWDFDDGASPAVDRTGRGHDAVWYNAPTTTTSAAPVDATDAKAIVLNGTNQWLAPANQAEFLSSAVTVACWVKPPAGIGAANNACSLFDRQATSIGGYALAGSGTDDGFTSWISGSNVAATGYTAGAWHHVAMTWDGTTQWLYGDGYRIGARIEPLAAGDAVWIEDGLPTGASANNVSGTDEAWTWVSSSPAPYAGSLAHQSGIAAGTHQHYFTGASTALQPHAGESLFAYVYLDPANPPSEVMLQWNDGTGNGTQWDHRAYWGANSIAFGTDGTASRLSIGALPATGAWVRLSVPASSVGLVGSSINGMAFTLYDGRATWDHAGKTTSGVPTFVGALCSIGRNSSDPNDGYHYDGTIDDLRVYNRALSQGEIQRLGNGHDPGAYAYTVSLGSNLTTAGDVVLASGRLDVNGAHDIAVGGSWTNLGGSFNAGTRTVTMNGGGACTIRSGYEPFCNLTLGGTGFWTALDQLRTTGTFLQSSGSFVAPATRLIAQGDFTVSGGTFFNNGGTVIMKSATGSTLTCAQALGNVVFTDGLIAHWRFEETASPCVDVSGWNHDARWVVSPTSDAAVKPGLSCDNNRSLTFDGSSTYLQVTDGFEFQPAAKLSVACWLYTNGGSAIDEGGIFGRMGDLTLAPTAVSRGYQFMTTGIAGQLMMRVNDSPSAVDWGNVTWSGLGTGAWHHVAFTLDGTNWTGYLDGAVAVGPVNNGANTILNPIDGLVWIGRNASYRYGYHPSLNAKLDDLRFYDRDLSASDVARLASGREPQSGVATFTLASNLSVNGNLTIGSGTLDLNSRAVAVAGNWRCEGKVAAGTSTVTLSGSGVGNTVLSGGQSFDNVVVGGTGTWTLSDWLRVGGTYTQSGATLAGNGKPITVGGALAINGGTLQGPANEILACAGAVGDNGGAGAYQGNGGALELTSTSNRSLNLTSSANQLWVASGATTGLVARFRLDEAQAGQAIDDVSGVIATASNTPTASTSTPTLATGDPYCLDFGGATSGSDSDYLTVANTTALDTLQNSSYSLSAWFWPRAYPAGTGTTDSYYGIVMKKFQHLGLIYDVTGHFYMDHWLSDGVTFGQAVTTATYPPGSWYHLCAAVDIPAGTVKLYVNGVLAGSGTFPAGGTTFAYGAKPWTIGIAAPGDPDWMWPADGLIDDVRFYSRALGASEALALAGGYDAANGTATFTLAHAASVDGDLDLIGGTLAAAGLQINAAAAWRNLIGTGAFTAGGNTVVLSGGDQRIYGSTTFASLTKSVASAATLIFPVYECQNVTGNLTLNGASGQLLRIRSSIAGSMATINPSSAGTRTCSYLDVKDSRNFTMPIINPSNSVDSGDTRWWFGGSKGNGVLIAMPPVE